MNHYDFVIVGGGPVGCRVATELAKAGHQVAVLEKNSTVGQPVCCTGIISNECLRRFAIPSDLILNQFYGASVYTPGDIVVHVERTELQAVAVDRGAFNACMARQAQDCGVDYLLGQRVIEIQINSDGVRIHALHNGTLSYYKVNAVVLACGFASRLPSMLGLGEVRGWTVGAQAEVKACDLHEIEVYLGRTIAPGYFAWLVPIKKDRALAGLMVERQAPEYLSSFISLMQRQGRLDSLIGSPTYRGITLRGSDRISTTRVLLAGDIAGHVKALTGGGLFFGLLCADIAASVLHQATEKNDYSAGSMRVYDKRCRDLLGRELRLGWLGHRLYGKLSDERMKWLIRWAQRNNMFDRLATSSQVGFDWHGNAMLKLLKEIAWPLEKRSCSDNPRNIKPERKMNA